MFRSKVKKKIIIIRIIKLLWNDDECQDFIINQSDYRDQSFVMATYEIYILFLFFIAHKDKRIAIIEKKIPQ